MTNDFSQAYANAKSNILHLIGLKSSCDLLYTKMMLLKSRRSRKGLTYDRFRDTLSVTFYASEQNKT